MKLRLFFWQIRCNDPLENFENEVGWVDYLPEYCFELSVLYGFIFSYLMSRTAFVRGLFDDINEFAESIIGAEKALDYNWLIRIIFHFAVASNVGSLFPGTTYIVPTEVVYPFYLSVTVFVTLLWIAYKNRGTMYMATFYNETIPKPIVNILFFIEVLSVLIRVVSLGLRMFANSVSGGILVKVFFYYVFILAFTIFPYAIFGVFTSLIGLAVLILEILVTVLQGFVFTLLFIIYVKEIS